MAKKQKIKDMLGNDIYEIYPDFNIYLDVIFDNLNKYMVVNWKDKGFAIWEISLEQKALYLHTFYINTRYRNNREGTKFLNSIINSAVNIGCDKIFVKLRNNHSKRIKNIWLVNFNFQITESDKNDDELNLHLVRFISNENKVYKNSHSDIIKTEMFKKIRNLNNE